MKDETFDIIDATGHVVRQAKYSEAHAKGLLHQVAPIFVFKSEARDEILLTKRSATVRHPLTWSTAGGHLLAGQTPEDAARMELREEVFYNIDFPDLDVIHIVSFEFNEDPGRVNHLCHLYEVVYPGPFSHEPKEVAEPPKWIAWKSLVKDLQKDPDKYSPVFERFVKEYQEATGR